MTSQMPKRIASTRRRWTIRVFLAAVFGIVLTQFFVYWPASVQDQSIIMQDGRRELGITKVRSPEYIRQFAHPLSSAFTSEMTFATQWTEFNYLGPKDELSDWDPTDPDQIPISVGITRFHFGWPFRAMYFDLIGISTEGRWDHMRSYFDSVNAAAGLNVGIETPDWWPAVRKNDRLPIRPHLGGLTSEHGYLCISVDHHRSADSMDDHGEKTQERPLRGVCVSN